MYASDNGCDDDITKCKKTCSTNRNYSTPLNCKDEDTNHGDLWVWNATGGRSGKDASASGVNCFEAPADHNKAGCDKWVRDNHLTGTWEARCNEGDENAELICVKTAWDNSAGQDVACCTGGLDNVSDCDPSWGKNNINEEPCQEAMTKYCTSPTYTQSPIFSIKGQDCQTWCNLDKNNGLCDIAMENYCKTTDGIANPLCSCINSSILRPTCFDENCTSAVPYKTKGMINDAKNCGTFCGDIINCNSYQQASCDQTVSNNTFKNICGTNASTTNNTNNNNTNNNNNNNNNDNSSSDTPLDRLKNYFENNIYIPIGIAIIVFLIILILIYRIIKG